MLRFAEYQLRLLLCSPEAKGYHAGAAWMHWSCGCVGMQSGRKKYAVTPCDYHRPLLSQVAEDDERTFDFFDGDPVNAGFRRRLHNGEAV